MERIQRLWGWWSRGFYDQVERQTDADLMVEYEDACAEFGADSPESRRLEHRVKEIQTRRSAII